MPLKAVLEVKYIFAPLLIGLGKNLIYQLALLVIALSYC